jgi:prevent-host-death family protein
MPVPTVNMHAAKTHLSRLVDEAAGGTEIIIAKAGRPVAKLVSLVGRHKKKRRLGVLAGTLRVPKNFDGPLPSDVLDAFEGR